MQGGHSPSLESSGTPALRRPQELADEGAWQGVVGSHTPESFMGPCSESGVCVLLGFQSIPELSPRLTGDHRVGGAPAPSMETPVACGQRRSRGSWTRSSEVQTGTCATRSVTGASKTLGPS
uniref:Uncharacterized protein n=1 Tax=Rousettus aegyptiacus TaxID=9407 RepID=A0A7J8KAH8_ROUAE|nr:hypothetical protein HJG63_007722 [Rousettus aegyptiacus]